MRQLVKRTIVGIALVAMSGCDDADWKRGVFENHFFDPGTLENPLPLVDRMAALQIAGISIAVIDEGEIHWAAGYGEKRWGGGDPVTPDTLFQAGSISKFVTAIGALRLAETGTLDLDADAATLLTSWSIPANPFTATSPVTARRLLSHTAGTTVDGFLGYRPTVPRLPTLVEILNGTRPANSQPIVVAREPGTEFDYSGGGLTVLQQLMIDVSGQSFADLLGASVLARAGMARSSFEQPLPAAKVPEAAASHPFPAAPLPGTEHAYVYPELAAAGLWTTASDLARLGLSLQRAAAGSEGEVLEPATAQAMLTPVLDGAFGASGLGVFFDDVADPRWFCHSGGNIGFTANLVVRMDGRSGVAVLVNDFFAGRPFIDEIVRTVALVYGWQDWNPDAPGC
jgi:CubicO group peptidase (beta-lactamase class C family)